jgi:hypothetical protein
MRCGAKWAADQVREEDEGGKSLTMFFPTAT